MIKTGDYSYSVRALIKGFQWSGQHKIKVKVDNYLKPLTPKPNAIVMLETFPNVKKFEWEGLKNQKYLFTLRKKTSDIDGEVLEKKMIKGTSHKFKFLEPGSYEWSLEHEKFKGIRIEKTAFLIQMPVAIKLKPVDNKKIILSTFNQNILFKWIAHKLVEKEDLTLLVSSKESFKDNIKVKQGKNRAQVKLNQLGKYYWKISPKKEKEDEVRYFADSKIQTFSLDYPLSKIKPSIAKSQFINKDIVSKKKGHKIKFKGVRFAKNYQVEIYADKKFKKLVTKTTTNKTTLYWISKRDGQHFIRVKTLDIWGRWSKYSNTGQLIFPISPLLE